MVAVMCTPLAPDSMPAHFAVLASIVARLVNPEVVRADECPTNSEVNLIFSRIPTVVLEPKWLVSEIRKTFFY